MWSCACTPSLYKYWLLGVVSFMWSCVHCLQHIHKILLKMFLMLSVRSVIWVWFMCCFFFPRSFESNIVIYQGNQSFSSPVSSISDLGNKVVMTASFRNQGPSSICNAGLTLYIPARSTETGDYYFYYPASWVCQWLRLISERPPHHITGLFLSPSLSLSLSLFRQLQHPMLSVQRTHLTQRDTGLTLPEKKGPYSERRVDWIGYLGKPPPLLWT